VLFAATGTSFLICRFDPFVSFFRLSGSLTMFIAGAAFLIVGTVVGRPYCRFLCPYGALLNLFSRFSRRNVTVTPDECVVCGLCKNACPFDAIRPADTEKGQE
jgi:polyferredoxin